MADRDLNLVNDLDLKLLNFIIPLLSGIGNKQNGLQIAHTHDYKSLQNQEAGGN